MNRLGVNGPKEVKAHPWLININLIMIIFYKK